MVGLPQDVKRTVYALISSKIFDYFDANDKNQW
jgi:hypothetical protein